MTGMAQDAARVDAEQQLDLVDPTGVNWREVKDEPVIVSGVEIIPHGLLAMGVQVVPHDVHAALGVGLCHLFHEGHEIDLGAPIGATAQDASGVHVHGSDEGLRAVADVLELTATCTTWHWRTIRVLALDGLDSGLLIDRQHDRALGRLTVQRTDRVDLLPELWVRAMQPLTNAVRAHVACLQDALQVAAADLRDHAALNSAVDQFVQRLCGASPVLQRARTPGRATPGAAPDRSAGADPNAPSLASPSLRVGPSECASATRSAQKRPPPPRSLSSTPLRGTSARSALEPLGGAPPCLGGSTIQATCDLLAAV